MLNENDYWTVEDERDFNYDDSTPISDREIEFANDLRDILQSLVDDRIDEEFTSNASLVNHFQWHCLGNSSDKKSTPSNIYYDFTKINQYDKYENRIDKFLKSDNGVRVESLYDIDKINIAFRKLFEGNRYITFLEGCDIKNTNGAIQVSLHAFASDVTTNYKQGNTIDICIRTVFPKTITLYAIDANKLRNKLLSMLSKYSSQKIKPPIDNNKLLDNVDKLNLNVYNIDNEENKMDKKQLLANYLGVEEDEIIDGYDKHVFEVDNGEEYWVGNYDEAYDEAVRQSRDIFEELGLDSLTSWAKDFVLSNDRFVNTDELNDFMVEDIRYYASEMDEDELVEVLYDKGILTDEDFEVDEDGAVDFTQCNRSRDDLIDIYVDEMSDQDPFEYFEDMLGSDGFSRFLVDRGLLDLDEVARYCVDEDGIAHYIASYDGVEIELGEDDDKEEIYAYRMN